MNDHGTRNSEEEQARRLRGARAFDGYEPIGVTLEDEDGGSRGRRRAKTIATENDGDDRDTLPDEPPPGWAVP